MKKREKIVEIKLSSTGPTGPNGASPSFADAEGQTPDPPETVISKLPRRVMGSNETITTHYVPE